MLRSARRFSAAHTTSGPTGPQGRPRLRGPGRGQEQRPQRLLWVVGGVYQGAETVALLQAGRRTASNSEGPNQQAARRLPVEQGLCFHCTPVDSRTTSARLLNANKRQAQNHSQLVSAVMDAKCSSHLDVGPHVLCAGNLLQKGNQLQQLLVTIIIIPAGRKQGRKQRRGKRKSSLQSLMCCKLDAGKMAHRTMVSATGLAQTRMVSQRTTRPTGPGAHSRAVCSPHEPPACMAACLTRTQWGYRCRAESQRPEASCPQ